jgi:acetyl-CoA synthetase
MKSWYSDCARRQDAAWAEWSEHACKVPSIPFEEHWKRYAEIFRDRVPEDGPPGAWQPSPAVLASSNLGRVMAEHGYTDYAAFHTWSASHRADFWKTMIERLGVVYSRQPDHVLNPTQDVRTVRWLPGAEMNCVDSLFKADPAQPAIVFGQEGTHDLEELTYGQLERRVNRVARGLINRGYTPGTPIALYMPMTVECIVAYLGIVRAGCIVVSIADSFSSGEIARRLEIAAARAIVTVDSYQRAGKQIELYPKVMAAGAPPAIVIPQSGDAVSLRDGDILWDDLLAARDDVKSVCVPPDTTINILFSSGTTGTPKAIPWTHLTPIKCAMDGHMHQDIHQADVVAWPTNIGWMMGPWLIFATLMNRATLALYNGVPSGAGFTRFIGDASVTMLGVVPALVRAWRLADLVMVDQWKAVRAFSSTGEPSDPEDMLWLMSRTGYRAPVIEYLGGTEIGGGHLTSTVVQPNSPGTFSTAALGIDVVVLDQQACPVADGGTGELYLVPPAVGLSQRLVNRGQRDHDKTYYTDCPAGPDGEVLRRHGDRITRLARGFYRAAGRADDTMNLGGIKVGSLDIEQVLDAHEGVKECAAVGVRIGSATAESLVVFVRLDSDGELDRLRRELATLLSTRLNPLFKIHDLVVVPELPRTASGKLMRRTLRERFKK